MPNNSRVNFRYTKFASSIRTRIAARCGAAFALLTLAFLCAACKPKQPTLTLLVWEGYADPTFIAASKKAITAKSSPPTWAPATN